ncbi:MAG: hypothetical protein LIR31_06000 [Bacteroidota bacterium]|nr:hypothetical protein [Bacteroidota bacterium]
MKKIFKVSLALLAILSLSVSCNKEINGIEDDNTITEQQGIPVTITASLSGELTKVALTQDPDNADGAVKLTWATGDKIRVASHADPTKFSELTLSSGAGDKTAEFSGELASGVVTPYDISYNSAGSSYNYAEQTQSADANTAHLKYIATLSSVSTYENVDFTEEWATANGGTFVRSSVLRLRANLPTGVAATVKSVIIRASENWVDGGDQIKVTIGTTGDAGNDGIINVYATLPASASTLSANATMEVIFETSGHDYLRQLTKENIGGKTFEMGKVNAIKLNCNTVGSNVDYADFAGGSGVSSDPWLISNARQMQKVHVALVDNETKYFKLTDDIDMSGESWTPLNNVSEYKKAVNFNGNNKTISNLGRNLFYVFKGSIYDLTLDNASVSARGVLTEYIQGTGHEITNVTISNETLSSDAEKVGALIGIINKGTSGVTSVTIDNCKVINTGITVSNSKGNVGGLVGYIDAKTIISNCSVYKDDSKNYTVTGANSNVGGLIGNINAVATVSDCSVSDINVTGTGVVGGVVGYSNAEGVSISGCSYSGGTVTATDCWCGGFVGSTGDVSATISDCHVTNATVTSSKDRVGGFVGQIGLNGVTVKGCTVGTELQIVAVHSSLSGANVNMGGFVGVCYGTVTKNGSDRSKAYVTMTSGNTSTSTYVHLGGFAGYLEGATIEYSDAVATMSSIKGHRVGGFAGVIAEKTPSTIDNCTANATVTGNNYVAGFIGHALAKDHSITNNSASGSVSGAASVAGFVGQAAQGTWTKNSTSCTVTASGANSGGFAGQLDGNITVSRCYSSGNVTGNGNVCGGFTGMARNGAIMNDCYSTSNLSGGSRKRGGMVGYVDAGTVSINRCYTTSNISNNFEMGGLVGFVSVESFTMTKCAAWNGTIVASSHASSNWSSAACVGVTYLTCTLTDNYRNPDMDSLVYWGTNSGCEVNLPNSFQHPDVSTSAPLTDPDGNAVTSSTMRPYQGKCDASKTLSQLASTTLGWSSEVWDFTGDLPTLK